MKKGFIDSQKLKISFSILNSLVILLVVSTLSFFFLKYDKNLMEDFYKENCTNLTNGYAQTIDTFLFNYTDTINALTPFDISDLDEKQIHKRLLTYPKDKINQDFECIFYINRDNKAYASDGSILELSSYPFINEIFFEGKTYTISDPFISPRTGNYIIVFAKGIFNKDGAPRGVLCASVNLQTFHHKIANLKSTESETISLIDTTGSFILHPKADMLFKKYAPADEEFSKYSTDYLSRSQSGCIETVNSRNERVTLVYQTMEATGWTLCVSVARNNFDNFYYDFLKELILITVITMIVLLGIEIYIMDVFQKKQLLATNFDPLTNFYSRVHFEKESEKVIKHYPNSKFMLIECDIHGFKFINQNYGVEPANKLLIFISDKIRNFTKDMDACVGRGFADHFYIFCKIDSVHASMKVFKEYCAQLNNDIKNYEIPCFMKYGIAFSMTKDKEKNVSITELIGQASFAKSTLKDNLINQYAIYNSKLLEKVNRERYIETHMEQALQNNEFFVMYQPKIDLHSDSIVGAEALVRWYNPEQGLITPDEFIPLFERNGFIKKLDFFVYDKVFHFLDSQVRNGRRVVTISVNMSRNHSKPEKFVHDFMNLFKNYSIPRNLIEVELIERSFMNENTLKEFTELLHKEGFTVAMDDFGSGESSLNMLTQIPVDVLKFDRTFLLSSTTENGIIDQTSANFLETLIKLSKTLNKQTIFEGVETESQRDFLKSINCDQVQGFFYSKPLTESDFTKLMEGNK